MGFPETNHTILIYIIRHMTIFWPNSPNPWQKTCQLHHCKFTNLCLHSASGISLHVQHVIDCETDTLDLNKWKYNFSTLPLHYHSELHYYNSELFSVLVLAPLLILTLFHKKPEQSVLQCCYDSAWNPVVILTNSKIHIQAVSAKTDIFKNMSRA